MELWGILQTTWKRRWLIVLGTLLISTAVFVASTTMQPIYQAKVIMMVNQPANAPLVDYASIQTGEELALTYSELLKTRPLLEIVIANLNLDLSPDDFLKKDILRTNLIPETRLLEVIIEDTDAQRASNIANEIAFTFISLHNMEQQLENVITLEEDVVALRANLKELIEYNQSRISSGLLTEEEINLVQTTLTNQQLTYASLLGTYLETRLTQAQMLDITVVEPAIPPTKPIRPNIVIYTLLGVFVGLVFSTGLAFLVEYINRSFETSEDVRQVLSLPTLGTIPRLRGRERKGGLVTSTTPRSPASEAYRTLRTNIRFASIDKPLTTLLITSTESGAGKTTVTANLGIVCAQAGIQVVLVDTDLRLPGLHRLFNLNNFTGLTDLLVGNVQNVQQCMVRTEIDNLRLITSGPVPPNPSELLSSKRMETVLAEVKQSAELVIFDAPPTLPVTDAAVLASKMDGVILLLEAGRTSHEAARRTREAHQRVGSTILGAVLTKVKIDRRRSLYYSYAAEAQPVQRPIWKQWLGRLSRSQ
jgi:non-specific protein-tyrosine kinase